MAPQLVETFPQQKGYLHKYCSTAIYILTLLLDGYKFSEHTWSSIHFRRQVRTLWALHPCPDPSTRPGAVSLESPAPEMCPHRILLPGDPSPASLFLPCPKPLTPACSHSLWYEHKLILSGLEECTGRFGYIGV